ncbi:ABC transporter ATP-binding protein/permease [Clostridium sp. MSJ-4]|uniref:ABC transporter ATP-binding protein/permease n=1 Tax=Clostridium simiarum TaxID=2841506 RepID=A0ABS6F3H5_9CLOT|nr:MULTISPECIES: ABC transporter ATP-binding protein [Clostridium]MBU5593029.1 ABC transporter ATP-binding protein/permease [Clostridium simiarum]
MKKNKQKPLKLLFTWSGKEKYKLYAAMALGLVSGASMMVPYMGIYKILESLYLGHFTREIMIKYSVTILLGVLIRNIFLSMGIKLSHKGAYNALYQVRCMVIEHISKVGLGNLNEKESGDIKRVINDDIEKLELFLAHHLPELVMYATGPIAVFIYLFTVNWVLALVSLMPIPIILLIQIYIFKKMSNETENISKVMGNLNSTMIDYIGGMRLIKAYNLGEDSYTKFANTIDEHSSLWKKVSYTVGPPFATFIVILESAVAFLIPIGGYKLIQGTLQGGEFILFVFVGSMYLVELRALMELGSSLSQVLKGIHNVIEILNIPKLEDTKRPFPKKHDIEFKNVSFSYDKKVNVLKNVNFHIEGGEKIAIVGKSGAGKSTIIQLLARFYDIETGEILIGNENIKDIGYGNLLDNISIVFQKPFLTRQSILENIKMGTEATFEEVKEAAKKAQIHDFIESLPDGYNTLVGNYGSRLSGGEKQRIAIARAILKDTPILILDEATAAADPENQYDIDMAIDNLCKGKTVLIVAHRLNIVNKCHGVMVVEDNTVKALGTHKEVFSTNSYYQKAWTDYNKARNISYGLKVGEHVG